MSEEVKVTAGLDAAKAYTAEVYSTRDALDIVADKRPAPEEIWGGLQLVPGRMMEIIGGSGLGKSRIVLNLAINQVLGRDFAGLKTLQRPLTWLFYGNENSFFRFRHDLTKMTSLLNTKEIERLKGHIFLPTLEKADDAFVSFSDEKNREKLCETMRRLKPNVLVLDPWGSIIDGDELSDGDVRRTLMELHKILVVNKDEDVPCVGIILNHSRNGLRELVDAAGPAKGNYGKNSKAIYSVLRDVWNLRMGHFDEPPTKIELIHAKSSDSRPCDPVAIDLDPDTLLYHVDGTFRHDVWQLALEKAYRSGAGALTPEAKSEARQQNEAEEKDKVVKYVTAEGSVSRQSLGEWMVESGIAVSRVKDIISDLQAEDKLVIMSPKGSNVRFIFTPESATKKKIEAGPDAYRVVKKTKERKGSVCSECTVRTEPPEEPEIEPND